MSAFIPACSACFSWCWFKFKNVSLWCNKFAHLLLKCRLKLKGPVLCKILFIRNVVPLACQQTLKRWESGLSLLLLCAPLIGLIFSNLKNAIGKSACCDITNGSPRFGTTHQASCLFKPLGHLVCKTYIFRILKPNTKYAVICRWTLDN